MPKGKPKKKVDKVIEQVETKEVSTELVTTEKEQLELRRDELLSVIDFLQTNKFQDIGQIEVALSQVNTQLAQL